MGRIATNPVKNYFLIDSVKHESTCKICKRILARNQSSNQEKHIERMHKDVFKELQALKAKQLSSFKKNQRKKLKEYVVVMILIKPVTVVILLVNKKL